MIDSKRLVAFFATALTTATVCYGHGDASAHKHDSTDSHSAQGTVLGHNGLRYQVDLDWAKADPKIAPVINSHALAEGRDGLIYVVTDHPKNAFVVFKKDGTFVRAFGKGLVGGHGIEIFERDGEERSISENGTRIVAIRLN